MASWVVVGLLWASAYLVWERMDGDGWFAFPMPAFMTGVLIFASIHNHRVKQRGDSYRQLLAFFNLESRLDQFVNLSLSRQEQFRDCLDQHGGVGFVVGGLLLLVLIGFLAFDGYAFSLGYWLVLLVVAMLFLINFSGKWFDMRKELLASLEEVASGEFAAGETTRDDSMARVKWYKSTNPADQSLFGNIYLILISTALPIIMAIPLMSFGNAFSILAAILLRSLSLALTMSGIIWFLAFPHPEQTVCFRFLARWRIRGLTVWVQTAVGGLVLIALGVATFYTKLKIFGARP